MEAVDAFLAKYGNVCDNRTEEEKLRDYYWDILDTFEGGYEVDTQLVEEAYAYFDSQCEGESEIENADENEMFCQNDNSVENQKVDHVWEEKYVDEQGKEIVLIHMPEWLLKCGDDEESCMGENYELRDSLNESNDLNAHSPPKMTRCISLESLQNECKNPCNTPVNATFPDTPTQNLRVKKHAKNRMKVPKPHTPVKSNGMPTHSSVEIPPTQEHHEKSEKMNVRMNTVSRVKVCNRYNLKLDKQSGKSRVWKYRKKATIVVAGENCQSKNRREKVQVCKYARYKEVWSSSKNLYFTESEIVKCEIKKPIVGIG